MLPFIQPPLQQPLTPTSPVHPPQAQVALNQLCLAPLTVTVAFAWNLALTGQVQDLPDKLRRDFIRTLVNGWKFWIPAATVNFVAVPLQYQVGWVGGCWGGFLCCYMGEVMLPARIAVLLFGSSLLPAAHAALPAHLPMLPCLPPFAL